MNSGVLWAVTADGIPQRVSSKEQPECHDAYDWQDFPVSAPGGDPVSVIKLCSTPNVVFCIDRAGQTYVFLNETHLIIRQTVSTYSNQRWYPVIGWCSRTLPTDRATFSNEDGSQQLSFKSFSLRSDGWRWEEPWIVAQDFRRFDKEGWEYAFNFGRNAEYSKQQQKTSFVRRRLFKRTMRYVATETWIQMAQTKQEHIFLDICSGHFASGSEGTFELFALSDTGHIFRREGISRNSPEGFSWTPIDGIPASENSFEDVFGIGSSPAHRCLLALTWDGRLFMRRGMIPEAPRGTAWISITLPNEMPITGFALGNASLWVVSVEAKVFTGAAVVDKSGVQIRAKFTEAGEGFCKMSCTANDQVFAIANRTELLHVRSNVSAEEPYGQRWLPVVHRGEEAPASRTKQVDAGTVFFTAKHIPPAWLDANFTPSTLDLVQIRNAPWRLEILNRLKDVNELCWSVYKESADGPNDFDQTLDATTEWMKSARITAILPETGLLNWADGEIRLDADKIQVNLKRGTIVCIPIDEICAVYPLSDAHRPSLRLLPRPLTANIIILGFSTDKERDSWHLDIEKEMRKSAIQLPRDRRNQWAWSLLTDGTVLCHLLSQTQYATEEKATLLPVNFATAPIFVVPGHFVDIAAGAANLVWAITGSGHAYALEPQFNALNEDLPYTYKQHDADKVTLVEYQKHALFRGFIEFEGRNCGVYAWSTLSGNAADKTMKLSAGWTWSEPEWRLQDDWEYGTRLDGEWGVNKNKAHARRRFWVRERSFESSGPWIKVEAPLLSRVYVSHDEAGPKVWVVTQDGDVLVRLGCERGAPMGQVWLHLPSDWRIRLLSVGDDCTAWALTRCGRLLLRRCANASDLVKIDWHETFGDTAFLDVLDMAANAKNLWMLHMDRSMRVIVDDRGRWIEYKIVTSTPLSRLSTDRDGVLWGISENMVSRKKDAEARRVKKDLFALPLEHINFPSIHVLSIY